ncbi:unnamed protein product, partial [Vitis vinifera]|uniref:Uncharacterized protein n=1 Tax=Vitis vinifera TaxID=29760 RepID=D7TFA1_VITVI
MFLLSTNPCPVNHQNLPKLHSL